MTSNSSRPNRPALFLHVGPHKTGTTYLQACLHHNRDKLAEQGLVYPEVMAGDDYGHHWIANYLEFYSAARRVQLLDFIEHIADQGAPRVLLSSENFDRLDPAAVRQCAQLLSARFDTTVIYAARSPIPLIWSAWQEQVKHGAPHDFGTHALRQIARPETSKAINHTPMLRRFARAFGRESLRIINYDRCRAENSLLTVFCSLVGCDAATLEPGPPGENASYSPEDIEIIRALNQMSQYAGNRIGPGVRVAFEAVYRDPAIAPVLALLRGYFKRHSKALELPGAYLAEKSQRSLSKFIDAVVNPPLTLSAEGRAVTTDSRFFDSPEALDSLQKLYQALDAATVAG